MPTQEAREPAGALEDLSRPDIHARRGRSRGKPAGTVLNRPARREPSGHFGRQAAAAAGKVRQVAGIPRLADRCQLFVARNAKLRRANRTPTGSLRLAAAQVQRLGMENARLREALEVSSNIARIARPGSPRNR